MGAIQYYIFSYDNGVLNNFLNLFGIEDIYWMKSGVGSDVYKRQDQRSVQLEGSSVGGGNILITRINGMEVAFTGQNPTLIILHQDIPGVIAEAVSYTHLDVYKRQIQNTSGISPPDAPASKRVQY